MNYTEIEGKVREATNDEAWGPTGPLMQELANATFTYEHFPEVMSMLWKRMLQDNKTNWRRTYKSLLLLSYLVRNGSERVVTSSREHIYDLRSLENYSFVDENGKDQGVNVRHKTRELIDFIQDDDKLREERKKAKKNKDKYIGMSSEAMGMRYGGNFSDRNFNDSNRSSSWRKFFLFRLMGYAFNFFRPCFSRYCYCLDIPETSEGRGENSYEDDCPYDGEREDSDQETGNGSAKRYYDRDSRPTDQPSNSSQKATIPPSFSDKSIKTSQPKGNAVISSKVVPQKSAKKIDLGAAASFGKSDDFDINSPTHTAGNVSNTTTIQANLFDIDENLFQPIPTEEMGSPSGLPDGNDFGDFSSANPTNNSTTTEFADFSSAFSSHGAPSTIPNIPMAQPMQTTSFPPASNELLFMTAAPESSVSKSNSADLLSDFGDLSLQSNSNGE